MVDEKVVLFVLPPDILAKLKANPINDLSARADERTWVNFLDGKFNSRDAYLVTEEESGLVEREAWAHYWVWKTNAPLELNPFFGFVPITA